MTLFSPLEFLKAANRTAHHFGFLPFEVLASSAARQKKESAIQKATAEDRKLDAMHGLLTNGVSLYFERGIPLPTPGKPSFFFSTCVLPKNGSIALALHIVGVRKSIAEALLIQALRSLARDLTRETCHVRINSLGDYESVTRYTRELGTYFRKRLDDMPREARELMRTDVAAAYLHLLDIDHELCAKSPSPLEYLSDPSRRHFREIVEHLDMTATPYEIDPRLMGHHHCYSDTLFTLEFHENGEDRPAPPLVIRGGRLDAFVKHAFKTDVPAAGAVIIFSGKKAPARMPRPRRATPSIFMVQIGFGPKIKSLILLDMLKSADIPVHQALVSDSLSDQLRQAETTNVPFSIILGQKEFVENSVILRDMRSRSQQQIPFDTLIPHLKRLLKKV
ncbi:hypothetical protein HY416_01130 [Candidatus Kaiserbacteria bacterium]|nr:hypothetical protein [Candidatus Kaiserbacteria bacterium]